VVVGVVIGLLSWWSCGVRDSVVWVGGVELGFVLRAGIGCGGVGFAGMSVVVLGKEVLVWLGVSRV